MVEEKENVRKSPDPRTKITRAIQNNTTTPGMENVGGVTGRRKIVPSLDLKKKRRGRKEIQTGQRLRILS